LSSTAFLVPKYVPRDSYGILFVLSQYRAYIRYPALGKHLHRVIRRMYCRATTRALVWALTLFPLAISIYELYSQQDILLCFVDIVRGRIFYGHPSFLLA
jgi:hypothetical protein